MTTTKILAETDTNWTVECERENCTNSFLIGKFVHLPGGFDRKTGEVFKGERVDFATPAEAQAASVAAVRCGAHR